MSKSPAFPDPHLAALAAVIGFTCDDLDANRRGDLTPRQVRRLHNDQRRQYWPSLIAWSALGSLVAGLALLSLDFALEWMLFFLIVVVLAGFSALELRWKQREIGHQKNAVEHDTFRVDEHWKPYRFLGTMGFQVGVRFFTTSGALLPLLRRDQRYRLYFAHEVWSYPGAGLSKINSGRSASIGSYRILSIEPIGPHRAAMED